MTRKKVTNIGASVRQRLLDKARQDKRPFSELLQYFAMERFLYRLSRSPHSDNFILKGALLLRAWQFPLFRPTMDIDMLGWKTSNDINVILKQVKDICSASIEEEDGLRFETKDISAERITEDAKYEGVRVRFIARLDRARINMQIDIGFGDIIVPGPQRISLPAMLDYPSSELQGYSMESSIAEKFEAMLKLGELNSRMKDFYDIWLLARQFNFDLEPLRLAISKTLQRRGTKMPEDISAFSDHYVQNSSQQWQAFRKRLRQEALPYEFSEIISFIQMFLGPVVECLRSGLSGSGTWKPPGPWSKK